MTDTTIPDAPLRALLDTTAVAPDRAGAVERNPVDAAGRQPVHTVYGGAHLFRPDTVSKLGTIALASLREYAPDPPALAGALDIDPRIAEAIYPRVVEKLERDPIEDYRIDFEDGFGHRPDPEEDRTAQAAADALASAWSSSPLPSAIGIRVKPATEDLKARCIRTFDLFLTRLLTRTNGVVPPRFVITLPKITAPEQVTMLASACDAFEYWREVAGHTLSIELMVETTEALVAPDGRFALPSLVAHGRGRVVGVHFGPYDYTAACGITAAHQDIRHPACDFARHIMQVSVGAAVRLSDGPTTLLPIAPHRAAAGAPLGTVERNENTVVVHRAWLRHARNIRHALVHGFYQGWDLHPAQLPVRYATVFAFFLEGLEAASERLRNFITASAQATTVRDVFDDAATGQGLLNYFLRAVSCGALSEADAARASGLTLEELRTRSFATIMTGRRR